MKQHWVPRSSLPARTPAADPHAVQRAVPGAMSAADALLSSTRLVAQRQLLQARFGAQALQRGPIEEEPLQGRAMALQRAGLEEEEPLQGRGLALQAAGLEEEELLQGQALALQRQGVEEEEPLQGKGLPPALTAGVQQLAGADLSDVRVHADSPQPAQVGALAYAQGNEIHLAPGQERHLPHEAWHVVQQRAGRVQPTVQAGGVPINDNPALEAEADRMGARAQDAGQRVLAQRRRRA